MLKVKEEASIYRLKVGTKKETINGKINGPINWIIIPINWMT